MGGGDLKTDKKLKTPNNRWLVRAAPKSSGGPPDILWVQHFEPGFGCGVRSGSLKKVTGFFHDP